jgi:hypothetical protein
VFIFVLLASFSEHHIFRAPLKKKKEEVEISRTLAPHPDVVSTLSDPKYCTVGDCTLDRPVAFMPSAVWIDQ